MQALVDFHALHLEEKYRQNTDERALRHPIKKGMRVTRKRPSASQRGKEGIVLRVFYDRGIKARVRWELVYTRFAGGGQDMKSTIAADSIKEVT